MAEMDPKLCINIAETIRYLGYGDSQPDENIMEELELCKEAIQKVMKPKYKYEVFEIEREDDQLYIGNHSLKLEGNAIKEHLNECELVALGCATLSAEVDELIDETQKKDMLHSLLLDSLANAAIEEVRIGLERSLAEAYADYEINWQFGIGYGDLPLSMQQNFLSIIHAAEDIGVSTNASSILIPLKSVSGFIGLKKRSLEYGNLRNNSIINENKVKCGKNKCENCTMKDRCMFQKRDGIVAK